MVDCVRDVIVDCVYDVINDLSVLFDSLTYGAKLTNKLQICVNCINVGLS